VRTPSITIFDRCAYVAGSSRCLVANAGLLGHQAAQLPGGSATTASLEKRLNLPDLRPHSPARRDCLPRPEALFEIAVAFASRSSGASCSAIHSASCTPPHRRLLARLAGSGPRPTPLGLGQIGQSAPEVRLTYGVVYHSCPSPSCPGRTCPGIDLGCYIRRPDAVKDAQFRWGTGPENTSVGVVQRSALERYG